MDRNNRRKRTPGARRRNQKRIRMFALLLMVVLLLLIVIVSKVLSGGDKKQTEPSTEPSTSETQSVAKDEKTVKDPKDAEKPDDSSATEPDEKIEETPKEDRYQTELLAYRKVSEPTALYQNDDADGDVITQVEAGSYAQFFGSEKGLSKVRMDGVEGYIKDEALEKIDDEKMFKVIDGLLIVNREFYLPEDYDPGVDDETMQAYELMREEMLREGLDIKIISGYRDYAYQVQVYDSSVEAYGKEEADAMTAVPGYSEHQTGLALDLFTNDDTKTINNSFDDTREAEWLAKNSYRFGFILRYPRGKENETGYIFESWHFRYVGAKRAKLIFDSGKSLEAYYGIVSEPKSE